MIRRTKSATFYLMAAALRIFVVFIILTVTADAVTRLFYMYAPIKYWLDFQNVRVYQDPETNTAKIEYTRIPNGQQVATYHRSVLEFWPYNRLTCSKSSLSIIEPSLPNTISFDMKLALADNCEETLEGHPMEGRMRISYIFEFPYGVKRLVSRYSNPFRLTYANHEPMISEAISDLKATSTPELTESVVNQ